MVIKDTYATGKTVEQSFYISSLSHPIAAKGVLKIEADLTPHGAGDRSGPDLMGWAPRTSAQSGACRIEAERLRPVAKCSHVPLSSAAA